MRKTLFFIFILLSCYSCKNNEEPNFKTNGTSLESSELNNLKIDPFSINLSTLDGIKVAKLFLGKEIKTKGGSIRPTVENVSIVNNENKEPLMYIVNFSNQKGFTIISATKKYNPILAYSDIGSFSLSTDNDNIKNWIEEHKNIIDYAKNDTSTKNTSKFKQLWQEFEKLYINVDTRSSLSNSIKALKESERKKWTDLGGYCHDFGAISYFFSPEESQGIIKDICSHTNPQYDCMESNMLLVKDEVTELCIDPLIKTYWHQGNPFNALCPPQTPAGCVAIAMAQIMKYYEWPNTYNWKQIQVIPTQPCDEVQKLIYDIGKAVKMEYTTNGSGTTANNTEDAFKYIFKYNARQITHDINPVINEIKSKRPVFMCGLSSYGGHAWVCDGYRLRDIKSVYTVIMFCPAERGMDIPSYIQYKKENKEKTEYLHMNWGWDEETNGSGWFLNDDISYSIDKKSNYTTKRKDIIEIYPLK